MTKTILRAALCLALATACGGSNPAVAGDMGGDLGSGGSNPVSGGGGPVAGSGGAPSSSGGTDSMGGMTERDAAPTVMGGASGGPSGCAGGSAAGPSSKSQTPGTWVNVTPPGIDLSGGWLTGPSPIGVQNVVVDPAVPSDVYLFFDQIGVYKSTDFGVTYKKISTGANSDKVNSGRPWSVSIDLNPCRDPSTPPTMYVNAGFAAGGLWKSTDGGVSFTNVFTDNIYAADGVTNISSHVGGDVANAFLIDPATTDHLVLFMHGEPDSSAEYKGLFETMNGGKKWIIRKSDRFTFAPHSDGFAPIDPKTWIVAAGTLSPGVYMFRSTDAGATWNSADGQIAKGMVGGVEAVCFQWARAESAIYTESTGDGVYKTTDKGATWTKVAGSGSNNQWVVATKTKVYTSDGNPWDPNPSFVQAPLDHDTSWQRTPFPAGMIENGVRATVTFDGAHYVIIAAQHKAGAWRYVEP